MAVNENFECQKLRNIEAFQHLFEIEVLLRELCASKLKALHGQHWAKRGLPPDVQQKVKESVTYEQKSKWHRAILHHPLYYVDFPDLKKIIVNGSNWNSSFVHVFGQKPGTESSLSDLELLRNQVAHNRFVSDADLTILKGIHSRLVGSLSVEDLTAAQKSASERIPVLKLLSELASSIDQSLNAMQAGNALANEAVPDETIVGAWWFDESYLGAAIDEIKSYPILCQAYSQIPRGFGQAVVRRTWVFNHDAVNRGTAALAAINDILKKGQNIYD
jgi:hypothetical protein